MAHRWHTHKLEKIATVTPVLVNDPYTQSMYQQVGFETRAKIDQVGRALARDHWDFWGETITPLFALQIQQEYDRMGFAEPAPNIYVAWARMATQQELEQVGGQFVNENPAAQPQESHWTPRIDVNNMQGLKRVNIHDPYRGTGLNPIAFAGIDFDGATNQSIYACCRQDLDAPGCWIRMDPNDPPETTTLYRVWWMEPDYKKTFWTKPVPTEETLAAATHTGTAFMNVNYYADLDRQIRAGVDEILHHFVYVAEKALSDHKKNNYDMIPETFHAHMRMINDVLRNVVRLIHIYNAPQQPCEQLRDPSMLPKDEWDQYVYTEIFNVPAFWASVNRTDPAEQARAEQARAEQARAEQARAEQARAEQARAEQARAEQPRAEQARAEEARAQQARAEQISIDTPELQYEDLVQRMGQNTRLWNNANPNEIVEQSLGAIDSDTGYRRIIYHLFNALRLDVQATIGQINDDGQLEFNQDGPLFVPLTEAGIARSGRLTRYLRIWENQRQPFPPISDFYVVVRRHQTRIERIPQAWKAFVLYLIALERFPAMADRYAVAFRDIAISIGLAAYQITSITPAGRGKMLFMVFNPIDPTYIPRYRNTNFAGLSDGLALNLRWAGNSCWMDTAMVALFSYTNNMLGLSILENHNATVPTQVIEIENSNPPEPSARIALCNSEDANRFHQSFCGDIVRIREGGQATTTQNCELESRRVWLNCFGEGPEAVGRFWTNENAIRVIAKFYGFYYSNVYDMPFGESDLRGRLPPSINLREVWIVLAGGAANDVRVFDWETPIDNYRLGSIIYNTGGHYVCYIRDLGKENPPWEHVNVSPGQGVIRRNENPPSPWRQQPGRMASAFIYWRR